MYIHFEFDNWSPWLMERDLNTGNCSIRKMIPPGKTYYFFSAGGEHHQGSFASDHLNEKKIRPKVIKKLVCREMDGDPPKVVSYEMNFILYRLNYVVSAPGKCVDPEDFWKPIKGISCFPRKI
jgi:hypothetical protein